jgi:hypothetical protein
MHPAERLANESLDFNTARRSRPTSTIALPQLSFVPVAAITASVVVSVWILATAIEASDRHPIAAQRATLQARRPNFDPWNPLLHNA